MTCVLSGIETQQYGRAFNGSCITVTLPCPPSEAVLILVVKCSYDKRLGLFQDERYNEKRTLCRSGVRYTTQEVQNMGGCDHPLPVACIYQQLACYISCSYNNIIVQPSCRGNKWVGVPYYYILIQLIMCRYTTGVYKSTLIHLSVQPDWEGVCNWLAREQAIPHNAFMVVSGANKLRKTWRGRAL